MCSPKMLEEYNSKCIGSSQHHLRAVGWDFCAVTCVSVRYSAMLCVGCLICMQWFLRPSHSSSAMTKMHLPLYVSEPFSPSMLPGCKYYSLPGCDVHIGKPMFSLRTVWADSNLLRTLLNQQFII